MASVNKKMIYESKKAAAHRFDPGNGYYDWLFGIGFPIALRAIPAILGFMASKMLMLFSNASGNLFLEIFGFVVNLASSALFIIAIFKYTIDIDAYECYKKDFDKSPYAIASGITKRDLEKDKGLIGEFRSYVLSRSLSIPHKILYNVCVPMPNGNFQEVDCIIITGTMVYVIECKNRGGRFKGKINDEDWTQYIGKQENTTKNIYIQNQKHTMAIHRFLLDKGIVPNGVMICMNVLMFSGYTGLEIDKMPMDFMFGHPEDIKEMIEDIEKELNDGTDTSEIMEEIYEALLPYSLYTPSERASMMEVRELRKKEFALGTYKQVVVAEGIPGVTEQGEQAIIRYNNVYTQMLVSNDINGKDYESCWQTRTDIPRQYLR